MSGDANLVMPREFDPQALLGLPLMANLATVAADGAPRNAPVWFVWEEEAIWMLGSAGGSAVKCIEREPRCAVEIVHFDNEAGILLHLGLRGAATSSRRRRIASGDCCANTLDPRPTGTAGSSTTSPRSTIRKGA